MRARRLLVKRQVGDFHVLVEGYTNELQISTLDMPRERHGSDYGRTSIQRLADHRRHAGCKLMRLDANKIGRYAWARCGFEFETPEDPERIVSAASSLAEQLGASFDADAIQRRATSATWPISSPARKWKTPDSTTHSHPMR